MSAARAQPRRQRERRRVKRVLVIAVAGGSGVVLGLVAATIWVNRQGSSRVVVDPDELADQLATLGITTVIVPGAGVDPDGTPSRAAKSRSRTAFGIYETDLVDRILVSGSVDANGNEPESMRAYLVELGVEPGDIVIDVEGTSTWKTCERAADNFGVTSAVIVTQREFGARAALTCRVAGLEPAIAYTPRWLKRGTDASLIVREGFANLKLAAIAVREFLRSG